MPVRPEDLDRIHDDFRSWGRSEPSVVESVVNELTKSYGFGRNDDGTWDWSIDRIQKSFEEQPLWTALDYASLALPILKWGTSIRAVKAGSIVGRGALGAAGRALGGVLGGDTVVRAALEGGELLGAKPLGEGGFIARQLNRFVAPETARAAEIYRAGPGRLTAKFRGRNIGLTNPLTAQTDSTWNAWIDKYGGEEWEKRAVSRALDRERVLEESSAFRQAADIQQQYHGAGLSQAQLTRAERLQRGRVAPTDRLVQGAFRGNQAGLSAYAKDYDFRMGLHQSLFDLDLISKDTYQRGLASYGPNLSAHWEQIKQAAQRGGLKIDQIIGESRAPQVAGAPALQAAKEGGAARLTARKMTDAEFAQFDKQVLDPRASLESLGKAAQLVARQRFAQKLATSAVAVDTQDMVNTALRIVGGNNAALGALHGVDGAKSDALREIIGLMPQVGRQQTGEEIAKLLGWKKIDQLYAKIPGYAQRLPQAMREKWIDPAAAEDIVGGLEFLGEPGAFDKFYQNAVTLFRGTKTALNPATWVRNAVGGVFFSHFARGGGVKLIPAKGLKAWAEGVGEYGPWRDAIGAGASFSVETRDMIKQAGLALSRPGQQASMFDWMGQGRFAQLIQKGSSYAEEGYRAIDEIWSLDTWTEIVQRAQKRGLSIDDARKEAAVAIRKFMPNFQIHSDLADLVRSGPLGKATAIPFASFTTETARIWKNVLQEKPHLGFLWNHAFESMSSAFAAFAGFSQDQVKQATDALPEYQQGKKMLVLPFNVDGRPSFVDMSYMLPLANLGEAQQSQASFFKQAIDITANPLLNAAIAYATGEDSFSGQQIQPRFTERQLGIPVTGERTRTMVGLAEHMAAMMLPPLVPPGYAGVNLLEAARGQINPATGVPLEQGVLRTILGNVAGVRAYTPDVAAQVSNVRREDKRIGESLSQAWERWGFARANAHEGAMETEEQRIVELRMKSGYTEGEARGYFRKSAKDRGPFSNISRRQMKEITRRTRAIGVQDEQSQALDRQRRLQELSALRR